LDQVTSHDTRVERARKYSERFIREDELEPYAFLQSGEVASKGFMVTCPFGDPNRRSEAFVLEQFFTLDQRKRT